MTIVAKTEEEKRKEALQKKVANHLDTQIGIYFSDKLSREKQTLGEFLAWSLRVLAPEYVTMYLAAE